MILQHFTRGLRALAPPDGISLSDDSVEMKRSSSLLGRCQFNISILAGKIVVGGGTKKGGLLSGFIIQHWYPEEHFFVFFFHRDYADDGAGADECKSQPSAVGNARVLIIIAESISRVLQLLYNVCQHICWLAGFRRGSIRSVHKKRSQERGEDRLDERTVSLRVISLWLLCLFYYGW